MGCPPIKRKTSRKVKGTKRAMVLWTTHHVYPSPFPHLSPCLPAGTYLLWRDGMQYNTTISVGDRVTWVWDDDFPHSIHGEDRLNHQGVRNQSVTLLRFGRILGVKS